MEDVEFYTRIRNGYLELARQDPDRIKVIEADRPIEIVHQQILHTLGI